MKSSNWNPVSSTPSRQEVQRQKVQRFNDRKFNDRRFNDRRFNDRKFNDRKFNDRKFNDRRFNDIFNDRKFNDRRLNGSMVLGTFTQTNILVSLDFAPSTSLEVSPHQPFGIVCDHLPLREGGLARSDLSIGTQDRPTQ